MFALKPKRIGCVRERSPLILEALEARLLLSASNPFSAGTPAVLAPLAVDTSPDRKVNVSIYDATGSGAVDPTKVKVVFGKNDSVTSISLTGLETMEGLGLVISGATSVGAITDARTTAGEVAFIASDSTIASLTLKSGMSGYDLNGATLGGIAFPAVIDAESATNDTALYCTGSVPSVTLGGAEAGDLVITGKDPASLLSNKTLTVKNGGLAGDLVTGGGEGAVVLAGDFTSTMNISGGVASLTITGGSFSGVLEAGGPVGAISVSSAKVGGVATGGNITSGAAIDVTGADAKTGLSVKSLSAAGAITSATLDLAGGLGALTGGAWTGGTAEASSAGAITLDGDFGTNFTLGGGLTSLTIKGGDFTGTLSAAGPVGTISVAEAKIGGLAESGGAVTDTAVIDITGADPKTKVALKSLSATGNVTGLDLTLTTGSLGSLAAGGAITGLDMTLSAGGVGSVTAASWTGGATQALSAGAITLSGDFGAQATFSGPVASLTIKGGDFTGSLTAAGPVGAISVASAKVSGTTAGGNITDTAAVDVTGADPKTKVALKSLSATGSITGLDLMLTTGSLGPVTARSWTGGTTKAASAGAISLSGDFGTDATFSGPVASLTIKGGDFTGSLTAAGPVGAISVASAKVSGATAGGNIADTAVIDITGANPKTKVALTSLSASGNVTGLGLTLTAGALGSLTAASWTGGAAQLVSSGAVTLSGDFDTQLALTGPLASLTIKGGEFGGSLTAGGAVGPISVASQTVSGKTVGGDVIAGAVIHVTGSDPKTDFSVKSLSAKGNIAGLNLNLAGGLGSLTAASWTGGTAQANASGAISLRGNFGAPLQLTNGLAKMTIKGGDFNGSISAGGEVGAITVSSLQTAPTAPPAGGNMNGSASIIVIGEGPATHLSLDSLTVAGTITALNLNLSGGLGKLTAGSWIGGTAQAASSGAVTVNGNFTGSLALTDDLASMTIKGGEFEGSISAGGPVGAVSVSSNTVNNVTQGGDLNGAQITVTGQDPVTGASVASLSATGHISASTLTLSGGLGSLSAGDGLSQDMVHAASLGAVTLTGDFDTYSQFVLTGGMASLTITGGDLDGIITAGGPVGAISVGPSKGKTTTGGAVNSAQIIVTGADPATGLSLASLSATGQIYSLTANLSGGLGSLTAGSWVGGMARAASVDAITLKGDFGTQATLTGSLGSLSIKGGDFTGSATVGGAVGTVSISSQTAAGKSVGGNIVSGATIALNGADPKTGLCLGSLQATGSITGLSLETSHGIGPIIAGSIANCNVTAPYVQAVTVSGDMTNSNFVLNGQDSQGDSLGVAAISGWFQDCSVLATSTIVSLSAGGSNGSTLYAGINSNTTGLVNSASDIVSDVSILSLTITGAVKDSNQDSLINSDIAAFNFSTINLVGAIAWSNNQVAFGISATKISSITFLPPPIGGLPQFPVHYTDLDNSITYKDANILILKGGD